jgi:hypothetical protein
MPRWLRPVAALFLAVGFSFGEALAEGEPEPIEIRSRCFDCHLNPNPPEGTRAGKRIDLTLFRESVHGTHRCESCHRTVIEIPHAKDLPPVECRDCHRIGNTAGAPQLPSYKEFEESAHGRHLAAGDQRAPRCQNCHGDHGILAPSNPLSRVNKHHIAETCGRCHEKEALAYGASSHGRARAEGSVDAPVCTDCHGEHLILAPTEGGSTVSREQVVETCASCHDDITKMGVFGDRMMTVEAYRESYHGVAYKLGSQTTATCVECHGYHDVRGKDDPLSTIHPANVPATCGREGCHVGAGPGFAKGRVHVSFHHPEAALAFEGRDRTFAKVFRVVELLFIGLTTSVIFSMIQYMALDLFDKWVRKKRKWLRYIAVATIPLVVTYWLAWKAAIVFFEKLRS